MKPVEISSHITWVGAVDWGLRDFHGYATEQGSTYNAYLVRGERTALVDTVKPDCLDQLMRNIREIMDPAEIDYVISNHAEMDHSGCLPQIMEICRPQKLLCSADGAKALARHFHGHDWPTEIVGAGDKIELGGVTLRFVPSKMLHWPDSMVSYVDEDRVLLSNDIFGQHLASGARFDDEVDAGELSWQSAKYFANIFWPTAPAMKKFLTKLDEAEIKPLIIAPDHGVVIRRDVDKVFARYRSWCEARSEAKAVVVFDSMWESTAAMAKAVGHGLSSAQIEVKICDLRKSHRSDVVTDVLDARALLMGSPVFNAGLLPGVNDFLSYLKGLKPRGKMGASFGSYGWARTCVKQLDTALAEMKIELVADGVSAQYRPSEGELRACVDLGKNVAEQVLGIKR